MMDEFGEENRYGQGRRYRSRDFRNDGSASIAALIQELHKLEQETHPRDGDASAKSKDANARSALSAAGRLVDALAGWALDHMAGLAKANLRTTSLPPLATRELPEYQAAIRAVDQHEHEVAGGILNEFASQADWDGELVRGLLINVMRCNPAGINTYAAIEIVEALSALEYGEVLPVLAPSSNRLKRRYQELHMQLRAICIVNYRYRHGLRKLQAQSEVASALGVDEETVRGWEKRLRIALGQIAVAAELDRAANQASTAQHHRRAIYADNPTGFELERHQSGIEWCELLYGPLALQRLAEQYKKLLRDKGDG